jgi:uncharacterized membrane protein
VQPGVSSQLKEFCLNPTLAHGLRSLQRNILAGIVTIAPLFVTYLIFSFLLGILAKAGLPLIWLLSAIFPDSRFNEPWIQFVLAILLTLIVLYVVGRVTSQVIGQRAVEFFEAILHRLPVVAKIYGSVRQLVDNMTAKKDTGQRVVLIEFPMAGQKCIGFLSRIMTDSVTGEEVAAVLLPNAINPTSALLQLVPVRAVTETDMTMEQAMSMLLTGGAVGPAALRFNNPGTLAPGVEPPSGTVAVAVEVRETTVVAAVQEEWTPPASPPADRPPL